MLTPCPGCGAQESHCREVLPACRKLAADRERRRGADTVADPHQFIAPPNPRAPSHFAAPGFVAFYPPMPGRPTEP